jgi:hypothetical protein
MPAVPAAPASVEFTAEDTVAVSVSPFTGQQQDWQASYLEASVSMPPLTHPQAQAWIAFLMSLRGQANAAGFRPWNSVVDGISQTGYSINLRGFTAGAAGVLLPGDWLQIGYRLYRTIVAANADGSGKLALSIWPRIRESPADGAAVVLTHTKGLWRLGGNARKWSISSAETWSPCFIVSRVQPRSISAFGLPVSNAQFTVLPFPSRTST